MIEMCLELLISGVLSTSFQNNVIDYNNNITYNIADKNTFVLPDKYNLMLLCENQKQRFANTNATDEEVFDLISSVE